MRRGLAGMALVLAAASGCSATVAGAGAYGGPPPSVSPQDPPRAALCATSEPQQAADCLRSALTTYWSGQAGKHIDESLVVSPTKAQIPAECQPGLDLDTAFFCPVNNAVYITDVYLKWLTTAFPGTGIVYGLAAVQAHEIGHVVQFAVGDPLSQKAELSDAESRQLEQQADCLGAVWAVQAGIDLDQYKDAAQQEYEHISTDWEIRTHGEVPQRMAAIGRGLAGRSAKSCGLTL